MKRATTIGNTHMLTLLAAIAAHLNEADQPPSWPNEEKVRQAYTDLVAWDRWLDRNRRAMPIEELQLHEHTLRWAKGVVKTWRVALVTSGAAIPVQAKSS